MNTTLNPRQLGTLLAALRLWQRLGERHGGPELAIATDEGSFAPLAADEIDTLCEQINLGNGSQDDATPAEIARARELYSEGSDDDIEIDDNAKASRGDDGCFIQAWVWLPNPDVPGEADDLSDSDLPGFTPPPLAEQRLSPATRPSVAVEKFASVLMQDVVGEYDTPDQVPEWDWVRNNASFQHRCNGLDGLWEWVLNLANSLGDAPARLKAVIEDARAAGASYLLIHQGT